VPATVQAGNTPTGIAVAPDGHSVYVANQVDGNVSQYSVAFVARSDVP
jgi:DNA-binding beta-propeller fold protein YncE